MPIVVEWGPNQANAMQLSHRAGFNQEQYARGMQLAQFLQQARQQHGELALGHKQLNQQESQFARTLPLQERGVQVQERGATVQEKAEARAAKALEIDRVLRENELRLQAAIATANNQSQRPPPYQYGPTNSRAANGNMSQTQYNQAIGASWGSVQFNPTLNYQF